MMGEVGRRWQEGALLACLLLYAGLLWIWGAGRLDIAHSMEAARAVGARGMMRTGDYVIPRIGDVPYLAKPPLFYWFVTLVSRPGGEVTATTVRLASALCAIGALLVLYFAARAALGPTTALVACLAAASLPMVSGAATIGDVNMMLALTVAGALFAAFYMLEGSRWSWLYAVLCGAGLAAGLMTKGPIGPLFVVPTVLLYLGYTGGGRLARDWRWSLAYMAVAAVLIRLSLWTATHAGLAGALLYLAPVGMLIYFGLRGADAGRSWPRWLVVCAVTLLLAVPWPLLALHRLGQGEVLKTAVREAWQLRSSDVGSSNRGPIWYYAEAMPVAALPFSLLVPLAFIPACGGEPSSRRRRMLLFAKCWLAGSLVLFTVVSTGRRARYLLPIFPAVSLLAADVFVRGTAQQLRAWVNRCVRAWSKLCVYAFCLGPVALAALWLGLGLPWSGWATVMTAVSASGAVLGLYLMRSGRRRLAPLVTVALVLLGAKVLAQFGYEDVHNQRSSPRPVCRQIRAHVPPGETLYMFGELPTSVVFYLDPEPSGLRQALDARGHAVICIRTGDANLAELGPGLRTTELDSARLGRDELVLLMVEKAPAGDGAEPRPENAPLSSRP